MTNFNKAWERERQRINKYVGGESQMSSNSPPIWINKEKREGEDEVKKSVQRRYRPRRPRAVEETPLLLLLFLSLSLSQAHSIANIARNQKPKTPRSPRRSAFETYDGFMVKNNLSSLKQWKVRQKEEKSKNQSTKHAKNFDSRVCFSHRYAVDHWR